MSGALQPRGAIGAGRDSGSPRVVVCGGGVAAVEALLALRELFESFPHVDLVAPNRRLVYQPLAVAEPFGLAQAHLFELDAIARDLGAELRVCSLLRVDGAGQTVVLADGTELPYDAAIIAVGARRRPWLAGAISFGGAQDAPALSALLGRLEERSCARVAFTAPAGASWSLPLYELALLTATRMAERGIGDVELTVATPEPEPLAPFGAAAGALLRGLLADRGIALHTGACAESLHGGVLELSGGALLEVDEVVALARLQGPRLRGLPADADGFITVDEHCRVRGLAGAYAAGDGAAFAVKQGGLAAQQADAAAEAAAADLGLHVSPRPFEPLLRAMLLTGVAPMYMRSDPAAPGPGEIASNPLWWPPSKIAGRHLGPYLHRMSEPLGSPEAPVPEPFEPEPRNGASRARISAGGIVAGGGIGEASELALGLADADAGEGDYGSALGWLEVVERLDGTLPRAYAGMREKWLLRARRGLPVVAPMR